MEWWQISLLVGGLATLIGALIATVQERRRRERAKARLRALHPSSRPYKRKGDE